MSIMFCMPTRAPFNPNSPLTVTSTMKLVKSVVDWASKSNQNDMCETCGERPKYVEKNGAKHPYCSRTCAASSGSGVNPNACIFHGCRATGRMAFSGFCSEMHGKDAVRSGQVEGCNQCKTMPQATGNLCFACDRRSKALRPRLGELDTKGATFKNVKANISSDWQSPTNTVNIEKIYEITIPRDVRARQKAYRKTAGSGVQELRAYHSCQCICDLGVRGATLCDSPACGICTIVKSSFKSFVFGAPHNTGRFGEGVYSYQNPALSDEFATSCISSPYRVMIVCDVIVGPGSSSPANNEESLFVPTSDAIIPTYVIMYSKRTIDAGSAPESKLHPVTP